MKTAPLYKRMAKKSVTADEKLSRVKRVFEKFSEYKKIGLPLDPDEMEDSFCYSIRDWARLSDVWNELSEEQKSSHRKTSIFQPVLRAVRAEFARQASRLGGSQDRRTKEWVTALNDLEKTSELDHFNQLSEWVTSLFPGSLWIELLHDSLSALASPEYLQPVKIERFRGNLMFCIAEINRRMLLDVIGYVPHGVRANKLQAESSKAAANVNRISEETEKKWKECAKRLINTYPDWKKTDVARQVAKETGGPFHTIRKRTWLTDLMKI